VAVLVRNIRWIDHSHQLTECSHREAFPSIAILSEPSHLNTLRGRITLHTSRYKRMVKEVGGRMDAGRRRG
jgi:hypothetical protein